MFQRFGSVLIQVMVIAGAVTGGQAGCAETGSTLLKSVSNPSELRGQMKVMVYGATDKNTADVFMSDLPRAALEPDADLSGVSGQLVHLHVFMTPQAGNTPIEQDACSVTVRTIVVARGQMGVYGGGAFLNPSAAPGDEEYSGSISAGTARLVTSTPGFVDRLGPSEFKADFSVPRDEAMTAMLRKRLATMLELMPAAPPIKPRP